MTTCSRVSTATGMLTAALIILYLPHAVLRSEATRTPTPPECPAADPLNHQLYFPLITRPPSCPAASNEQYVGGIAYQRDFDDPVRPAAEHADKNIELRGYTLNDDPYVEHGLVDYGSDDDTQPPQLATLFDPPRVPAFPTVYRIHQWDWAPSPAPGAREGPIQDYPVTALGMETAWGEPVHVPQSGYSIGGDPAMEVLVLYADEDTVTLRYTRDDSSAPAGYTLHIDNVCTDPNLLALYDQLDDPNGPRYVYTPPGQRPYTYPLPNLAESQLLGTGRGEEMVVSIADTGSFQDPRSMNEWWQIRPGHVGSGEDSSPINYTKRPLGKSLPSPPVAVGRKPYPRSMDPRRQAEGVRRHGAGRSRPTLVSHTSGTGHRR